MKALKGHYPRDVSVVLVDVDVIVHVDVIAPVRWPTRKTSTSTTHVNVDGDERRKRQRLFDSHCQSQRR